MALLIIAIVSVAIAFWAWHYISSELKDVDPAVLLNQTSVSETRRERESAIHRSVDVPHGAALTAGLRIQVNFKVRDGMLKDIWQCAMRNNESGETTLQWGQICYTTKQTNWILHEISSYLIKNLDQRNGDGYGKVAVCVRDLFSNPQALLFILSSFFVSEFTIVNYTGPITNLPDDIDTVLVDSFAVGYVKKLGVKNIIVIGEADGCISFNDIFDLSKSDIPELEEYAYQPSVDYTAFNNQPYTEILNGAEIKFYQRNFVASIASKLMSLQSDYTWKESDNLLIIGDGNCIENRNLIFTTLCGLLSNVNRIQYCTNKEVTTLEKLSALKGTILSVDTVGLSQLTRSGKKHMKKSFILQRAEYFNSNGVFSTFGKLEKGLNLKIVYVSQYDDQVVSSASINLSKSVLGSRIIRETLLESSMGPVLKTNLLDYRITHYGHYQLLGVPSNCMETKVVFANDEDKTGSLLVRGMALGRSPKLSLDSEQWLSTGIKGRFAKDGCFYGSI